MIVMVEQGRLGNQIFQYLALRSVARPHEKVRLMGFDQLRATFDGLDARFTAIDGSVLRHLRSIDYARLRRVSSLIPGFDLVEETTDGKALAPNARMRVCTPAWFQSPTALNSPALAQMSLKPELLDQARSAISGRTDCAFIHVRAGDYRTWPSPDAPAILSPQWYRTQLDELRRAGRLHAFVVGDEPEYVDEIAAVLPDSTVIRTDERVEFALLTQCRAGVLSASTFAYWGAYFAHRRAGGHFIAPQYWAGHASQAWFPPGIESPFLDYRPTF
ncbi:MAG: alpha-1,2-fucosyltransferase [Actinomycetota bacterium]|nr:alpha-1,2-fucosyltransferase [Actinomycetota bacterium]